jgi:pyrroline-5-carboxylate reductase
MAAVPSVETPHIAFIDAGRIGIESDIDLRELRREVTRPAGTTEAAIHSFENENLRSLDPAGHASRHGER